MNNFLHKKDNVSLCHDKKCIHAGGQNAKWLVAAFCTMLVLIGLAAFTKNS